MNFKSSEQLIARVSSQLDSFQSSGLLDEGDFYRWIKEILTLLNIPAYSPVHSIIPLEDNKFRIPDDMYQLWNIYRYEEENIHNNDNIHYQRQSRYEIIKTDQIETTCTDNCEKITHESDIMISKYYIKDNQTPVVTRYNKREPIRIKNYTVNKCTSDAPCIKTPSRLEGSIDGNYFYFNFQGGSIYLQYYRLMLDDNNLPMIPDVSEIELAIETYIVFRFFQKLYYNTTTDALQRMQYAQLEYTKAYDKARSWVKTPSAKVLHQIARNNRNKFKVFELKHSRD